MTDTTDIEALAADMRDLADRIIECQGENSDGEDIIRLYDHSDTVFKAENILLVLDGLEAERQQRELLEVRARNVEAESKTSIRAVNTLSTEFAALHERCEKAEAELAALRGTQEPDGYIFQHPTGKLFWSIVSDSCAGDDGVVPYYLTRQPSSVVVLPRKIEPWEVIDILGPTANPEDYACCVGADMYNAAIKACHKSLQSAGIVVKDGE